MSRALAIDLYAGLGGWTEGLLDAGYEVIGFDIERHVYGEHRYPAQLVLQDVRTLDGRQFKDASLIVASPPCQEFSYMAMPWTRAKQIAKALRGEGEFPDGYTGSRTIAELTALFDACFRIQREASEAAERHIPMVVENVRGAQPWVGRAKWHHGSYYLWGDVPALMPMTLRRVPMEEGVTHRGEGGSTNFHQGRYDDGVKAGDRNKGRANGSHEWTTGFDKHIPAEGFKGAGMNWSNQKLRGQDFTRIANQQATKNDGGSWFNVAHNTTSGKGQNPDGRLDDAPKYILDDTKNGQRRRGGGIYDENGRVVQEGVKVGGRWFHDATPGTVRATSSKSTARKAASARIAKIPFALARHIAEVYAAVPAPPTEK